MREDRHISADPSSLRREDDPAHRVEDEILRFPGTTEVCFESMFWRSWATVHKARLMSAEHLRISFPDGDSAEHGYFARDATLEDFVPFLGAARTFMPMILGFKRIVGNAKQFLTNSPRVATVASRVSPSGRLATLVCPRPVSLTPIWSSTGNHGSSCSLDTEVPGIPQPGPRPRTPSRRASLGDVESLAERSVPVSPLTNNEFFSRRRVQLVHYCCNAGEDVVTVAMVQRTKKFWPDVNTTTGRTAVFHSLI